MRLVAADAYVVGDHLDCEDLPPVARQTNTPRVFRPSSSAMLLVGSGFLNEANRPDIYEGDDGNSNSCADSVRSLLTEVKAKYSDVEGRASASRSS